MCVAALPPSARAEPQRPRAPDSLTLVLAGDVMIGRGIDQVLPEPLPPQLYEPWVGDAREYVRLAERLHGAIQRPVAPAYPWGEALPAMQRLGAALRIVNLETALTTSGTPWSGKGIHYRSHPAHVGCLVAAGIDACVLANNHVLDWGIAGLHETLAALRAAGIACAGAGADQAPAEAPAVLTWPDGTRLLLFARATPSSGVPPEWAASAERPGVACLQRLGDDSALALARSMHDHRRPGDRVIVSLHWGANWVDEVPAAHRRFARRLIDLGAADVVHGHSSHHPLPIEVHGGRLILYGCGDLINDYEGITPRDSRPRSDLVCVYAASLSRADGRLDALSVVPFQLRRLQLSRPEAAAWRELQARLATACSGFGTRLEVDSAAQGWRLAWGDARVPPGPSR
jgi:poly-gamma-glutamate synthesis protein (capsule biosynthesis protein)